ncbi:hypothetical protein HWV62_38634 [Athelia sp. TMB]|nr:hypothetical protein HWV62_38634 [Athelia sp. TMB]
MVYINDKKFACASCVKGHRSSSCKHTDRPLFEIKKKGRPVSQCEKCRELRQSKKMHSKCLCAEAGLYDSPAPQTAPVLKKKALPGPDLPPILLLSPPAPGSSRTLPSFPTIPPLSAVKSIAGSGCTCGLRCACPGCTEHRGANRASTSRADCASGACTSCIDWEQGVELPSAGPSSAATKHHQSIVEQFLKTAAALPLPPRNRNRYSALELDPGNVTVYPADLFAMQNSGGPDSDAREAFGLVKLLTGM